MRSFIIAHKKSLSTGSSELNGDLQGPPSPTTCQSPTSPTSPGFPRTSTSAETARSQQRSFSSISLRSLQQTSSASPQNQHSAMSHSLHHATPPSPDTLQKIAVPVESSLPTPLSPPPNSTLQPSLTRPRSNSSDTSSNIVSKSLQTVSTNNNRSSDTSTTNNNTFMKSPAPGTVSISTSTSTSSHHMHNANHLHQLYTSISSTSIPVTHASSSSGSLKKLNPISYIRRRRASNDDHNPDFYIPSAEEYKEAGTIFGTRTHDWGSTPSTSKFSSNFHPTPVFCPPGASSSSNGSFGSAAGQRSASVSAADSSPSPSLPATTDAIKMARMVVSPTYSEPALSQPFSSVSLANSSSNLSNKSDGSCVSTSNLSTGSSANNANGDVISMHSAMSKSSPIILSASPQNIPSIPSILSSDLVREQDETESLHEVSSSISKISLAHPFGNGSAPSIVSQEAHAAVPVQKPSLELERPAQKFSPTHTTALPPTKSTHEPAHSDCNIPSVTPENAGTEASELACHTKLENNVLTSEGGVEASKENGANNSSTLDSDNNSNLLSSSTIDNFPTNDEKVESLTGNMAPVVEIHRFPSINHLDVVSHGLPASYSNVSISGMAADLDIKNGSTLDITSLTKELSTIIRKQREFDQDEAEASDSNDSLEGAVLPNQSNTGGTPLLSSSLDSSTPALYISKCTSDNNSISVIEQSLTKSDSGPDAAVRSELEDDNDQRSMFSFEEDSMMGRNSSINYHKPFNVLDQSNEDELAAAAATQYDSSPGSENMSENSGSSVAYLELDDVDMDEYPPDTQYYDEYYSENDDFFAEDDAHLFGATDLNSIEEAPFPQDATGFLDNVQEEAKPPKAVDTFGPAEPDFVQLPNVSEHEDEDSDLKALDKTPTTNRVRSFTVTGPTPSKGGPISASSPIKNQQITSPTTPISAKGLGALRYQQRLSQSSPLFAGMISQSSPYSSTINLSPSPSNASQNSYLAFGGARGTSRSSLHSTHSVNSLHSTPSLRSYNGNEPLLNHSQTPAVSGSLMNQYQFYGNSNTSAGQVNLDMRGSIADASDTASINSTDYSSAIDYPENDADDERETSGVDVYSQGQHTALGSVHSLDSEFISNYRSAFGGADADDFDDSLLDEVNAVPEDYGDSDDDIFTRPAPCIPGLRRQASSSFEAFKRNHSTYIPRSSTYGSNNGNGVIGLRKTKSYSFDKREDAAGTSSSAAGSHSSKERNRKTAPELPLRRQTSIIRTENTTTTLFSPLSRREKENYYQSILRSASDSSSKDCQGQSLSKKSSTSSNASNTADLSLSTLSSNASSASSSSTAVSSAMSSSGLLISPNVNKQPTTSIKSSSTSSFVTAPDEGHALCDDAEIATTTSGSSSINSTTATVTAPLSHSEASQELSAFDFLPHDTVPDLYSGKLPSSSRRRPKPSPITTSGIGAMSFHCEPETLLELTESEAAELDYGTSSSLKLDLPAHNIPGRASLTPISERSYDSDYSTMSPIHSGSEIDVYQTFKQKHIGNI